MVIGSFFLLNLFIGVVISSFNRQKEEIGGMAQLSEIQKQWIETHLTVLKCKPMQVPRQPTYKLGEICYKIYIHKQFENFIYCVILLNFLVLMFKWEGMSPYVTRSIEYLNIAITGIFILEIAIKLPAMGHLYFMDSWNVFDILVVFLSLATIGLDFVADVQLGSATTVIRSFRVSKILRLVKRSKSLKHIFKTFIVSLKPLANIGSLLLLILYMYAIAGVILFGQVMRNGPLDESLNFESFGSATLTLFIITTTDGWTDIARACLKQREYDY